MNKFIPLFKSWFGYAAAITLVCGIIYATVQQGYRQTANDPQFQLAEDAANALSKGIDPKAIVGNAPGIEISQSLSPYLIIYNGNGSIAATNATLDGNAPRLPQGVLNDAHRNGTNAVTWQPRAGVRSATVSVRAKDYIVTAGRSLRMTEERIGRLGQQILFGWFMSLIGMAVILVMINAINNKPALG
jgi:hypothetical protein